MARALTKAEAGQIVLRLVVAGFYPREHFMLHSNGQIFVSPEARSFLRRHPARISAAHYLSDRSSPPSSPQDPQNG